jgi:splicing factor 3A subunit 3
MYDTRFVAHLAGFGTYRHFLMDSIIEQQRQTHEEIERLESALGGLLAQAGNNVRAYLLLRFVQFTELKSLEQHDQTLANEHRAKDILGRISNRVETLSQVYSDVEEYVRYVGSCIFMFLRFS